MWLELHDQGEESEERQVGARLCRRLQTMVRGLDLFRLNGRALEGFNQGHDLKLREFVFKR